MDFDHGYTQVSVGSLRLAKDPRPDTWLDDFSQVMTNTSGLRPEYGNFWAFWPCRLAPHVWRELKLTETGCDYPRAVQRCQRCGSQVHMWWLLLPPRRGKV